MPYHQSQTPSAPEHAAFTDFNDHAQNNEHHQVGCHDPNVALYAILAGFEPDDTPAVGAYYDFMKRIIDGPYRKPSQDRVLRSRVNAGKHRRNIKSEKAKPVDDVCPNQSQSEALANDLLEKADEPL